MISILHLFMDPIGYLFRYKYVHSKGCIWKTNTTLSRVVSVSEINSNSIQDFHTWEANHHLWVMIGCMESTIVKV